MRHRIGRGGNLCAVLGWLAASAAAQVVPARPGADPGVIVVSGTPAPPKPVTFTADPNPVPLPQGATTGRTTLSWNAPAHDRLVIRANEKKLADGLPSSGTFDTGNVVTDGMVLALIDPAIGQTLTSITIKATTPAPPSLSVTTTSLAPGLVGVAYNQTVTGAGGKPPYTFAFGNGIGFSLPPGLNGSAVGVISGIPTTVGTYIVQITLSDSAGARTTKGIPVTISPGPLTIVTTSLPSGQVGMPYNQTVAGAGGKPPYAFAFVTTFSTSLPPGLNGSAAGVISGIPTSAGVFSVQIRLSDSAGGVATIVLALVIAPPPALTVETSSLPSARVGQLYNTTVSGSGGKPPYSWAFGNGIGTTLPPGLNGTSSGIISGVPTTAGNYGVQISVWDSAGAFTTKAVNLLVSP